MTDTIRICDVTTCEECRLYGWECDGKEDDD